MSPLVLGILSVLVGVAASVYLWGVRRRQAEMAAGLTALAAMRWRDFASLIIRMLNDRGYTPTEAHPLGSGDQRDFVMQRMGQPCVVSCRHGSVYHLGAADLKDLGDSIRLHDAASGIMVTAGQFAADAQARAASQRIELIDGTALWLEIAPLLPAAQRQYLQSIASSKAKRQIGIVWLFAAIAGVAIALLPRYAGVPTLPMPVPASTEPGPVVAVEKQPSPLPAVKPIQRTHQSAAEPPELQQRQDARDAIAALPGVERALWSTQSTLSVFLLTDQLPWLRICEVLDRYPAVRAVRVQLTPPAGSTSQVRFRQCYAY